MQAGSIKNAQRSTSNAELWEEEKLIRKPGTRIAGGYSFAADTAAATTLTSTMRRKRPMLVGKHRPEEKS